MGVKVADEGVQHKLGLSGSFKKGTWKPHVSVLADVARMTDPEEMKERVKTSWTTIGIVSALVLTMTYPSIVQPPYGLPDPNNEDVANDSTMQTFNILNIISFVLALDIDIIIVIMMTQLDLCCTPEHTRAFLIRFSFINELLTAMFSLSILVLGAQVMCITWFNYPQAVNISTLAVWGVFITITGVLATMVAVFNRVQVAKHGQALLEANTMNDSAQ